MSEIERYLLRHGGWVSVAELCRLFPVKPRELRSRDDRPGICSAFAISGNEGLKHIDNATEAEWQHCRDRLRKHCIGQFLRLRRLRRRWAQRSRQPELALT